MYFTISLSLTNPVTVILISTQFFDSVFRDGNCHSSSQILWAVPMNCMQKRGGSVPFTLKYTCVFPIQICLKLFEFSSFTERRLYRFVLNIHCACTNQPDGACVVVQFITFFPPAIYSRTIASINTYNLTHADSLPRASLTKLQIDTASYHSPTNRKRLSPIQRHFRPFIHI